MFLSGDVCAAENVGKGTTKRVVFVGDREGAAEVVVHLEKDPPRIHGFNQNKKAEIKSICVKELTC